MGSNKKWIPIHSYVNELGEEKCCALPFWYGFTGCDSVSQFGGRGKKTAWDVWGAYPDVTETFIQLSGMCDMSPTDKKHLERYVCQLYDGTTPYDCVNECRRGCSNSIQKGLNIKVIYGFVLMLHILTRM